MFGLQPHQHELSDLVVDIAPDTLERRPVRLEDVLAVLVEEQNTWGLQIARTLPTTRDGLLDPEAIDHLLVRCHRELQRLALELQQGARAAVRLAPVIAELRDQLGGPVRVVDVGCGIGYVLRWLAAHSGLEGVEWIGCDFNASLLDEARRLATEEDLPVRFLHRNAFSLDLEAHIFLSTGVLHHLPAEGLSAFFRSQVEAGAHAFLHADFQASPLAGPGSWMFHRARMREPLARHDGILSALRAHPTEVLRRAAEEGVDGTVEVLGRTVHPAVPIPRAMVTIGWRR